MTAPIDSLRGALDLMEKALEVLYAVAGTLEASIEGQIIAATTPEQRESLQFESARGDAFATGLDYDIALLREIEDIIGKDGRDGIPWLHGWIDGWEPLTQEEIAALTPKEPPEGHTCH